MENERAHLIARGMEGGGGDWKSYRGKDVEPQHSAEGLFDDEADLLDSEEAPDGEGHYRDYAEAHGAHQGEREGQAPDAQKAGGVP